MTAPDTAAIAAHPAGAALLADMAGQKEIAAATGESQSLVNQWVHSAERNGFPAPVLTMSAGRFWLLSQVLAWRATYTSKFQPTKVERAKRGSLTPKEVAA